MPVLFFHGFGSSRVVRHPDDGIADGARGPGHRASTGPASASRRASRTAGRSTGRATSSSSSTAWASSEPPSSRGRAAGRTRSPAAGRSRRASRPSASSAPRRRSRACRGPAATPIAATAPRRAPPTMPRGSSGWRCGTGRGRRRATRRSSSTPRSPAWSTPIGEILGDPALRAVMIANAAEMYRQGNGGVYDEAHLHGPPVGLPRRGCDRCRCGSGTARSTSPYPVGMGRYLERTLPNAVATFYPHEGAPLRLRPLARDPRRARRRGELPLCAAARRRASDARGAIRTSSCPRRSPRPWSPTSRRAPRRRSSRADSVGSFATMSVGAVERSGPPVRPLYVDPTTNDRDDGHGRPPLRGA